MKSSWGSREPRIKPPGKRRKTAKKYKKRGKSGKIAGERGEGNEKRKKGKTEKSRKRKRGKTVYVRNEAGRTLFEVPGVAGLAEGPAPVLGVRV